MIKCAHFVLLFIFTINLRCSSQNNNGSGTGATWESLKLREGQSLEDLLHWSIVHSDPQALEEKARETSRPEAHTAEILDRQQQVAQLLDAVKQQPNEAALMAKAIARVTNDSETDQARHTALAALRVLVEPIDNANDLHKMGGLAPVVALLAASSPTLQAAAAYVLGTAASNNPPFQATLLEQHPQTVAALLQIVHGPNRYASSSDKEAKEEATNAALYAMAAMVRVHVGARALFYAAGGMQSLESVLVDSMAPVRLRRKALNLIADVVQLDSGSGMRQGLDHASTVGAILGLLAEEPPCHPSAAASPQGLPAVDLELQEKALLALRVLVEHQGGSLSEETLKTADAQLEALGAQLATDAGSAGMTAEEEGSFLQDVMDLVQDVKRMCGQQLHARDRAEL